VALLLAAAVAAYVVGRANGGTLPRLVSVPLARVRLLVVALALQVGGGLLAGHVQHAYAAGATLSALFVLVFLARNRGVPGAGLLAAGLLANVAVVVANGSMPVSEHAALRAGVPARTLVLGRDSRHEALGPRTRLPWLADRLPVALPPHREVASPGDLLAAAGVGLFVAVGMNRQPQAPGSPGGSPGRVPSDRRPATQPSTRGSYASVSRRRRANA